MVDRRSFLAATGAGLTGVLGAGCGSDEVRPDMVAPTSSDDPAWSTVRAQFLTGRDVVYMNNASLGMPPMAVAHEVAGGFGQLSSDPLRAKHDLQAIVAERSVPKLAAFVGADTDEISLTRNATDALHLATIGMKLEPGDQVLMTTQEHPAGARPWHFRAARHGIDVREVFIPSPFESADQIIDLIEQAMTSRTRGLAFCHVTRGGHRYPVKELCAMARERGVATSVDGAQAVGMFPIDLHDLGCDVYSASLHKWLLGPIGTGMLYVRRDARDRWTSAFAHDATTENPAYAPPGTADLPPRAAISTAVDFINSIGIDQIAARDRMLSNYVKERAEAMGDVRIVSNPTDDISGPGSSIFVVDGMDPYQAVAAMDEQKLYIDEHDRDGHPALRLSTHFYNSVADVDRVMDALESLR